MTASPSWAWWRRPVSLRVPPATRARGYGLAAGLALASVPLLHLYLPVDLSRSELAIHALDIALGTAAALVALDLVLCILQRRLTWRYDGTRGGLAVRASLVAGLALALSGRSHDLLPHTRDIRREHAASGYGDMAVRVLPISALIGYLSIESLRRASLSREVEELRALGAALAAARTAPATGPAPRIVLSHDGGELGVATSEIVRVQARENYCEFVLIEGEGRGGRARPLVRMTLAEALARLPGERFVQTHRSHLVNLDHVRALVREGRHTRLRLTGGEGVPVARGRVGDVRRAVRRFLAGEGPAAARPARGA